METVKNIDFIVLYVFTDEQNYKAAALDLDLRACKGFTQFVAVDSLDYEDFWQKADKQIKSM